MQAMDTDLYQCWPAAAHILGHLYNYDLCANANSTCLP